MGRSESGGVRGSDGADLSLPDAITDSITNETVDTNAPSLASLEFSSAKTGQVELQTSATSASIEEAIAAAVESSIADNSPSQTSIGSPALSESSELTGSDMDRMTRGTILQRPTSSVEEPRSLTEPFPDYSEPDLGQGWSAGMYHDLLEKPPLPPRKHSRGLVPPANDPVLFEAQDGPFVRPQQAKPLRRGPKLELDIKAAWTKGCRRSPPQDPSELYDVTPRSGRGSCNTCAGRKQEFSAVLQRLENEDKNLVSRAEVAAQEREINMMLLENSGDCGHVDYLHWALMHPGLKPNRHDRCPCNVPWFSEIVASPEQIVESPQSSIFVDSPLSLTQSTRREGEHDDWNNALAGMPTELAGDSIIWGYRSDSDLPLPEIGAEGYAVLGAANGSMSSSDLILPSCLIVEQQSYHDEGDFSHRTRRMRASMGPEGLGSIWRRSSRPPMWAIITCGVALMLSISCLTLAASITTAAKMLAVTAD